MLMSPVDENGYNTLCIPAEGQLAGKILPDIKGYINFINEPDSANSNVNKLGMVTDRRFPGFFIQTAPGKFGVVFGSEFNPLIFRGENKYYEKFVPSAKRYGEDKVRHCIDTIKKKEFLKLFQTTPYYTRCRNFEVLSCKFEFDLEAVAQHYGFMSNYIDVSKDMGIAMFFAYTYYENGRYFPITDFEEYTPFLYIGNLKELYAQDENQIKLIGFQSLLRPFLQRAMAIEVSEEHNAKQLFRRIELPKEKLIANEIFAMYNSGEALFPPDYGNTISRDIKKNKFLYREFFDNYCTENNLNAEEFIDRIRQTGYDLTEEDYYIPEASIYKLNREMDDYILPFLRHVSFRGCSEPRSVQL